MNTYDYIHDAVEAGINEGMTVREFLLKASAAWQNVCEEEIREANIAFGKAIKAVEQR